MSDITLDHPITKTITQEWVTLTPQVAEKWLGQNHGNRNLRSAKVKAFARDMRNGDWKVTSETIGFDYNGTLIDGQHRCEAVIESGTPIRVLVVRGLDPSARQVIDTGTKRTPGDALKFAGHPHAAHATAAAARIALGREHGALRTAFSAAPPNITNAETVEWVTAHPEIESAVALAVKTTKQIGIAPSPWAYVLYELQKVNPMLANEFAMSMHEWRGLEGKGDPRAAMLTAFRNAQLGRRRIPTVAESIYIAYRAWNAWATGRKLQTIVPRDASGKGNDIPKLATPTDAVRERYGA